MVYIRKSISNMSTAAVIATRAALAAVKEVEAKEEKADDSDVDENAATAAAAVAVFEVSPLKAPAAAALAVMREGCSDAVATAVAAGVAAACVGWNEDKVHHISEKAARVFSSSYDKVTGFALNIAKGVPELADLRSRYPDVNKAAHAFAKSPGRVAPYSQPVTDAEAAKLRAHAAAEIAAAIAADVAEEVRKDSSRYAAVEAAAAAAYAAHRRLTGRGGAPPSKPVTTAKAAEAAAKDEPAKDELEDAAAAALAAAAAAAGRSNHALSKGDFPYDIASSAAIAAATAAINRGAPQNDAVKAAAEALKTASIDPVDAAIAAAASAAAASAAAAKAYADSAPHPEPVPIPTFGALEYFERMPDSHEFTKDKLQKIMEVDTFLAGFLLFSLTGRKEVDQVMVSESEKFQVAAQTLSFGVFLAATIYTGMCTISTGGRYALTSSDLILPFVLSTIGFVLLLVSVGSAVHIELGDGFYHDDENVRLFWGVVGSGLGCSLVIVAYIAIKHVWLNNYKWDIVCRLRGGCRCRAYRVAQA